MNRPINSTPTHQSSIRRIDDRIYILFSNVSNLYKNRTCQKGSQCFHKPQARLQFITKQKIIETFQLGQGEKSARSIRNRYRLTLRGKGYNQAVLVVSDCSLLSSDEDHKITP
jgi:hypothetical protein